MTRLILQREKFRKNQPTLGRFYWEVDGFVRSLRIDCLELPWENNEPKKSCIPEGEYDMKWTVSPKFKRYTWELFNVPHRTAIRIHSGNFAGPKITDSLGCPLPCLGHADLNGDGVIDGVSSRLATGQLEGSLKPYQVHGMTISVRNAV